MGLGFGGLVARDRAVLLPGGLGLLAVGACSVAECGCGPEAGTSEFSLVEEGGRVMLGAPHGETGALRSGQRGDARDSACRQNKAPLKWTAVSAA